MAHIAAGLALLSGIINSYIIIQTENPIVDILAPRYRTSQLGISPLSGGMLFIMLYDFEIMIFRVKVIRVTLICPLLFLA